MKKRITGLFIILTMLISLVPQVALAIAPELSGSGTSGDPYLISSADDFLILKDFADHNSTKGMNFKLTGDIEIKETITGVGSEQFPFEGRFYCDVTYYSSYHTIHANIVDDGEYVGLFNYVGEDGEVCNIRFGGSVRATGTKSIDYYIGSIAGLNRGTIDYCGGMDIYADGENCMVGGIAGYNSGTIVDCNGGTKVYTDGENCIIGGVVGYNSGTVDGCRNNSDLAAEHGESIAGIAGACYGESAEKPAIIKNCHNNGDIYAPEGAAAGLVVAMNKNSEIIDCYNKGEITSDSDGAAGIVYDARADGRGKVIRCDNYGVITSGGSVAGGIAAKVSGTAIGECYNTGNVICTRDGGGNIVGGIAGDVTGGYIYQSHNKAEVAAQGFRNNSVGGIAGEFGYREQSFFIEGCSNTGRIVNNGYGYTGGIVGINHGSLIREIRNAGNVEMPNGTASSLGYAGGIAGANMTRNSSVPLIKNAYSACSISAVVEGSKTGAITADNGSEENTGRIENCYYLEGTAGSADGAESVAGKITKEQSGSSNTFSDWDFDYTWKIDKQTPVLISEDARGDGTYDGHSFGLDITGLKKLGEHVRQGYTYAGRHFILSGPVNLFDEWTPIGSKNTPFMGCINGGGYLIDGFRITKNSEYNGFIGYLGSCGSIDYLVIEGLIAVPDSGGEASYTGAVAGYSEGTIENCLSSVAMVVEGSAQRAYAGGLVGYNNGGEVCGSHNAGNLTIRHGAGEVYAGGITGFINRGGLVADCYSDVPLTSVGDGAGAAGQIVGASIVDPALGTAVKNCYYYGDAKVGVGNIAGGECEYTGCYYLSDETTEDGGIDELDFKSKSTFKNWDFEDTWRMDITLGRPILSVADAFDFDDDFNINGLGTEEFPYEISNEAELQGINKLMKDGLTEGVHFKLVEDLVLDDAWTPIGTKEMPFKGVFDGNGKVITLMRRWLNSYKVRSGVFGYVSGGEIKNLTTKGELAPICNGGVAYVAAIAEHADNATFTNCVNRVKINITESYKADESYIGGIVGRGENGTVVEGCGNIGTISINGKPLVSSEYIGGIAGEAQFVNACVNLGQIHCDTPAGRYIGGIAAVGASISKCRNDGSIDANDKSVIYKPDDAKEAVLAMGGIGAAACTVEKSANHGGIDADVDGSDGCEILLNTGGVLGTFTEADLTRYGGSPEQLDNVLCDSYNDGKLYLDARGSANVGGVCGLLEVGAPKNCHNSGGMDYYKDGDHIFIDAFGNIKNAAINCYYRAYNDNIESRQDGVYGLTEEQLSDESSFKDWDFNYTWTIKSNSYYTGPDLRTDGTENRPYTIDDAKDLKNLADSVNGGNDFKNCYFRLQKDIDLTGVDWEPVGLGENTVFEGVFDGNGNKITGLSIKCDSEWDYAGLFGACGSNSVIKNLTVEADMDLNSDGGIGYAGAVAGYTAGAIENCDATAEINTVNASADGIFAVGAVAGYVDGGSIKDSTGRGCITTADSENVLKGTFAGGIAGYVKGVDIAECENYAEIESVGEKNYTTAGGIVGGADNETDVFRVISGCSNEGNISGATVGGIVGFLEFGGAGDLNIENCYNAGEIHIAASENSNKIASGAVIAGGIAGACGYGTAHIINSYNYGAFTSDMSNAPCYGIGSAVDIQSSYCLDNVQYSLVDADGVTSTTGIITAAKFADKSTFEGWDFADVWIMDNSVQRPMLKSKKNYAWHLIGLAGDGSEENPYLIPDLTALKAVRAYIDSGSNTVNMYFKQTADIDLGWSGNLWDSSQESWEPIGSRAHRFNGTFDGDGHKITGLYIDDDKYYTGLFGYIGGTGTVKNVTIENGYVGNDNIIGSVGAVAGGCDGTIENCVNKVAVSSYSLGDGDFAHTGGIVGYVGKSGRIIKCGNEGDVYSEYVAGGVAGYCAGEAENLYNAGMVEGITGGGVIGSINGGTLNIAYNTGTIFFFEDDKFMREIPRATGQIAGKSNGEITSVYYRDDTIAAVGDGVAADAAFIDLDTLETGEFAYTLDLLQSERGVWGQKLGTDTHPVFASDDNAVYKLTFVKDAEQEDNSYQEEICGVEYVNPYSEIIYPEEPVDAQYKFKWWTADKETKTEFETPVTSDATLYAVGEEKYGASNELGNYTTTYGDIAEVDLSALVAFADARDLAGKGTTSTKDKFTYTILDNGGCTAADISGDNLVIPAGTNAGTYSIKIQAERNEPQSGDLMLFAVPNAFDTVPVTLNVTVQVNKRPQTLSAPEMAANSAGTIRLKTVTADGGKVQYALIDENHDGTEPIWQDSPLFEGLTPETNYWAYAKTEGDENHIGTLSGPTLVRTASHEHRWIYTVSGNVISAKCIGESCAAGVGGTLTLYGMEENPVYDGAEHSPRIDDNLITDDLIVISYYYRSVGADDYTAVDKAVNAGDYKVEVTVSDASVSTEYSILQAHDSAFRSLLTARAYYTQTLGDIELPKGYSWDDGADILVGSLGVHGFDVTYTPSDNVNYLTEHGAVIVEVMQMPEEITGVNDESIDFAKEKITGFESGSYEITCGDTVYDTTVGADGELEIAEPYFGNDIAIVKKARNDNYTDSEALTIYVPERPDAPEGIMSSQASGIDIADGVISGVDETMEYTSVNEAQWISVDSTEISGLLAGAYYVRVRQSGDNFAGKITTVIVGVDNTVTATFIDGNGKVIKTAHVESGSAPSYDINTDPVPKKDSTAQYDYIFTDWDTDITLPITEDTTYTAQFDAAVREYTVRWIVNGVISESEAYKYGEMPYYGSEPTREGNAQYHYVFAGWTPDIRDVIGDAVYVAVFEQIANTYSVTLDTNGGAISAGKDVTEYTYGAGAKLPSASEITREGYIFLGWYDENGSRAAEIGANETGDKEYTAQWMKQRARETIIQPRDVVTNYANETLGGFESGTYTVTLGGVSETVTVASDGTIPVRETYFGNTISIMRIARNSDYLNSNPISINVKARPDAPGRFRVDKASTKDSVDGKIINVNDSMEYRAILDTEWTPVNTGTTAIDGLKAGVYYVRYKHTESDFAGKSDIIVIGIEDSVVAMFVDGNGDVIKTEYIPSGNAPSYDTSTDPVPEKDSTAQYEYTFTGWDKDITLPITEDTTYTAQFNAVLREYTITWIVDGKTTESTFKYGTLPSYGSIPTKETDDRYSYKFAGWEPSVALVTGDAQYTAVFERTAMTVTVMFVDGDGKVLSTKQIAPGNVAVYEGDTPTKAASGRYTYKFKGWTPDISKPVTENTVFTALFDEVEIIPTLIDGVSVEKVKDGGEISFVITAENSGAPDVKLYKAIYNSDGSLKSVALGEAEYDDETLIIRTTETRLSHGETGKMFLWAQTQRPVTDSIDF